MGNVIQGWGFFSTATNSELLNIIFEERRNLGLKTQF